MDPRWGEIPSVESEIEILQKFGSTVIALALNTEDCSNAEALNFQSLYENTLGIPVLLPMQQGVGKIIPVIQALLKSKAL